MKATKAYIASLGTTGVLLAASILMLAVVSAVVAFDRWPGSHVSAPVQTLLLTEKAAPIRVSATSTGSPATAARTPSRVAAAAPRVRTGAGDVGGQRVVGGIRPPAATTPAHATPAAPQDVTKTLAPVQDTTAPLFGAVSNPRTTAGQVADGAQAVTNAAAGAVTAVSPDVSVAVSTAGESAAATVRDAPLPDHLVPGY
jgi:hypothetical protein